MLPIEFKTVPAGRYLLGSRAYYREEAPGFALELAEFEIATTPVTNAQFARFVAETGWVTDAELTPPTLPTSPTPSKAPDTPNNQPGSMVFRPTSGPVSLADWRAWWHWTPGANWRAPQGPGSSIEQLAAHPVVQVSHRAALGFCEWAGFRLPTEDEWEVAARGGLIEQEFAWGATDHTPERLLANTWQGRFPYQNDGALGWRGTSPVGAFPPNGYGLFDMVGNVWEWTNSPWTPSRTAPAPTAATQVAPPPQGEGCGCGCRSASAAEPFVIKGGSHLCTIEYCFRHRPAARSAQDSRSATTHLGFRVAKNQ